MITVVVSAGIIIDLFSERGEKKDDFRKLGLACQLSITKTTASGIRNY